MHRPERARPTPQKPGLPLSPSRGVLAVSVFGGGFEQRYLSPWFNGGWEGKGAGKVAPGY